MQNAYSNNYFISEPIFKLFVALCTTHELQKDGMVIFFLWCFRKVKFQIMQFLKDGVQTVESRNFGLRKKRDCTIHVAKTKVLISCAVTAQLICAFVPE